MLCLGNVYESDTVLHYGLYVTLRETAVPEGFQPHYSTIKKKYNYLYID